MDVLSIDEKQLHTFLDANKLSAQVKSKDPIDDEYVIGTENLNSVKVLENFTSMMKEAEDLERSLAFNSSKKDFNNKEEIIIKK